MLVWLRGLRGCCLRRVGPECVRSLVKDDWRNRNRTFNSVLYGVFHYYLFYPLVRRRQAKVMTRLEELLYQPRPVAEEKPKAGKAKKKKPKVEAEPLPEKEFKRFNLSFYTTVSLSMLVASVIALSLDWVSTVLALQFVPNTHENNVMSRFFIDNYGFGIAIAVSFAYTFALLAPWFLAYAGVNRFVHNRYYGVPKYLDVATLGLLLPIFVQVVVNTVAAIKNFGLLMP